MNGRRAVKAAKVEPNYVSGELLIVKQKADSVVVNHQKNKSATQTYAPQVLICIKFEVILVLLVDLRKTRIND